MSWGTLGGTIELDGASGRNWKLRFERQLAPRQSSSISNPASSVWLVRDESSLRLYAAKRQNLASPAEIDALVDEAAAWRAACLADNSTHIVELIDVFVVRSAPYSVTFLAEFCSRGLLPRRDLSEPVLLTIATDLSAAAAAMPSPHGHIAYESLLVDAKGCIRVAGFGAHRSAILRDNPGLTPSDDAFDIGLVLYNLIFDHPVPEDLFVPESSRYSPKLVDIVRKALNHPHPSELREAALSAGAEARAPVIDTGGEATVQNAPVHVSNATERNVDRLIEGVDIATTFSAMLSDLEADPDTVSSSIFKVLFKKPVSNDPLCTVRAFTMVHNLILDGPEAMLSAVRNNDKFMQWSESSWSREAVEEKQKSEDAHKALPSFAAGELAFYASFLRRKARFHQLAAGGFSGRWDRTGATNSEGRDVLETRRRRVVSGMADLAEMVSELGGLFAAAKDVEAPAKHASLGAMISECCLAYNAAFDLAHDVHTVRDAEKLAPGIARLYSAARALVFSVEHVPSAGGEPWVEQFASDSPPDIVSDIRLRNQASQPVNNEAMFPKDGWDSMKITEDEEERKQSKKKKQKKKSEILEQSAEDVTKPLDVKADEENDAVVPPLADEANIDTGALVVHGADEASAAITTMFGDLLQIDNDTQRNREEQEEQVRPMPNMSNTQALASAFGVPEEAIAANYEDRSREDYDYEEDGGGGYEEYQAQQEGRHVQSREARGPSTAAWAAKAGYGTRALVVSDSANLKKSHPVFCQCAICQREEDQAAAAQSATPQHDEYTGKNGQNSEYDGNRYDVPNASHNYNDYHRQVYRNTYGPDGDVDSLDAEDGLRPSWRGPDENASRDARTYYKDDYDSYESITYSVGDDKHHEHPVLQTTGQAIPLGSEHQQDNSSLHPLSKPTQFKLDAAHTLKLKKLRTGDKIGDGEMIVIHKGEYNRQEVAIKKLTKKGLQSEATVKEFTNEVKIICALNHENIISCIAAILEKPNYILVTQMMKRGTLFDVLYKNRIRLTWALIRKITLQLAEGMRHIHDQGFIHRDLKSLNIFIDNAYNIKVGDFGLACHVTDTHASSEISGTYQYMAPEVLKGEAPSFKSDVYSFAVILCEMVSGVPPFHGLDARAAADRVVNEDLRPSIPMSCKRSYVDLIQKCWGTVPSTRPSFAQLTEQITTIK